MRRVLRKIFYKLQDLGYCKAEIVESENGTHIVVLDDIGDPFVKFKGGYYFQYHKSKENRIIDINKLKLKKLLGD